MSEYQKLSNEDHIAEYYSSDIVENEHSVWGHGTLSEQIADEILQDGIIVDKHYGLHEIAVQLPEDAQKAAKNICDWKHRNTKFIIILSIPHSFSTGLDLTKQQMIEEVRIEHRNNSFTRIPPRFIKGYFDVQKGQFIRNPAYRSDALPTVTDEELIKRDREFVERRFRRAISSEMSVDIPKPSDHSTKNEDVW